MATDRDNTGTVLAMLLGIGIGITTLILATMERAKAAPPPEEIPTPGDIMMSESIAELNAWYNLINELYITEQITYEYYSELYDAYYIRWYQLQEVL